MMEPPPLPPVIMVANVAAAAAAAAFAVFDLPPPLVFACLASAAERSAALSLSSLARSLSAATSFAGRYGKTYRSSSPCVM